MSLCVGQESDFFCLLHSERYRDLIDAADSVVAMSNSARNVVQLVATAQGACQHIQQTHFLKGTGGRQAPPVFR